MNANEPPALLQPAPAQPWYAPGETQSTSTPGTQSSSSPTTSYGNDLMGQGAIALLGVVAVILVCAFLLKRMGMGRNQKAHALPVVASRQLGQRERVVVIDLEGEWLVLGVTPHQITSLHRRPAPERPETGPDEAPNTVAEVFGRTLRDRIQAFTGQRGT